MKLEELINQIIDKSADYEDGETGADACIDLYCEEEGIAEEIEVYTEREALAAGIPLSVIRGEKKLSDVFSQNYIDFKCGRVK